MSDPLLSGFRKHNQRLDGIESIMDQCYSPEEFLDLVAEVLSAKADHLRENWQDADSADHYDRLAGAVLNVIGTGRIGLK